MLCVWLWFRTINYLYFSPLLPRLMTVVWWPCDNEVMKKCRWIQNINPLETVNQNKPSQNRILGSVICRRVFTVVAWCYIVIRCLFQATGFEKSLLFLFEGSHTQIWLNLPWEHQSLDEAKFWSIDTERSSILKQLPTAKGNGCYVELRSFHAHGAV